MFDLATERGSTDISALLVRIAGPVTARFAIAFLPTQHRHTLFDEAEERS